jgi:hypothetical protein
MDKNQDLGSGINIPDPQHWYTLTFVPNEKMINTDVGYLEPTALAALHSREKDVFLEVEADEALPLLLTWQRELYHLVQPGHRG